MGNVVVWLSKNLGFPEGLKISEGSSGNHWIELLCTMNQIALHIWSALWLIIHISNGIRHSFISLASVVFTPWSPHRVETGQSSIFVEYH